MLQRLGLLFIGLTLTACSGSPLAGTWLEDCDPNGAGGSNQQSWTFDGDNFSTVAHSYTNESCSAGKSESLNVSGTFVAGDMNDAGEGDIDLAVKASSSDPEMVGKTYLGRYKITNDQLQLNDATPTTRSTEAFETEIFKKQ